MATSEQRDRRNFLRMVLARVLGSAGIAASFVLARAAAASERPASTAMFDLRRLSNDPKEIAKSFSLLRYGGLSASYQLFWPFVLNHADLETLDIVADSVKPEVNRHRPRLLANIGRLHVLGQAQDVEREEVESHLAKALDEALNPNLRPNRQIIEAIWQNALTSLTRNASHWRRFDLSPALLRSIESLHFRFGHREPTLTAASFALLQFLLTYQRALAARRDSDRRQIVDSLIARLLDTPSPHSMWLKRLAAQYRNRHALDDMLPQQSEALMAIRKLPDEAASLFVTHRLESNYALALAGSGKIENPYGSDEETLHAVSRSLTAMVNYRVDEFYRSRSFDRDHLDASVRSFYEGSMSQLGKGNPFEQGESRIAHSLSDLVPFRFHDETTIFEAAFGSVPVEKIRDQLNEYGFSALGILKAAEPVRRYHLRVINRMNLGDLSESRLESRLEELSSAEAMRGPLSML